MPGLSPEALEAIEKARKLLQTQGRTEEEAAVFVGKAMAILAKHNLTVAELETKEKGAGGARSDVKRSGGLYQWQRDLWDAVAQMNFCVYFSIKGLAKGSKYEQRLVGRQENVISTEVMAGYLQQTIERLAQTWANGKGINVFCREAIAYREGMADRLVVRLRDLARTREEEQAREAREQASRSRHPSSAPSAGTSLVLADVLQTEADLNTDYLWGREPGTTARNRAASEARQRAQEEAYRKWAAENPEEFAKQQAASAEASAKYWKDVADREAKRVKRALREGRDPDASQYRAETEREKRQRLGTYSDGWDRGGDIGLDQQVGSTKQERLR